MARQLERYYTGDSPLIQAYIYDENDVTPTTPTAVTWEFVNPDGSALTTTSLPASPATGDRVLLTQSAGGFDALDVVEWNGSAWTKVAEATSTIDSNQVTLMIPGVLTETPGLYRGRAITSLSNGATKSDIRHFEILDPFELATGSDYDASVDHAWMKLEDLFDSELGGPWLRDKTFQSFNRDKMARLAPDAAYLINATYQPPTGFTVDDFPYTQHSPLFSQALLVETIYHLIRSYTEQPMQVGGGNISYFDKRDYMQRWQSVLEREETKFLRWLDMFKRGYMNYGSAALLVGGYSNSGYRVPTFYRSRYPFIWRW